MRNAILGSYGGGSFGSGGGTGHNMGQAGWTPVNRNFGGVATTRQGGVSLVPTPLRGGVTMPNFQRMQQMFMQKRSENPEDYKSLKQAAGGQFARSSFGAFRA